MESFNVVFLPPNGLPCIFSPHLSETSALAPSPGAASPGAPMLQNCFSLQPLPFPSTRHEMLYIVRNIMSYQSSLVKIYQNLRIYGFVILFRIFTLRVVPSSPDTWFLHSPDTFVIEHMLFFSETTFIFVVCPFNLAPQPSIFSYLLHKFLCVKNS